MKLYTDNERKVVTKHPTCIEVGECRPKHRGTKDTKHWCKGRVGIPHAWEWLRSRYDVEAEQRFPIRYNRITEHPVCFGCEKVDYRRRSYCRLCGEPWPTLHHTVRHTNGLREWVTMPCVRCGAAWSIRPKVAGEGIVSGQWVPTGSVRP